MKKLGVLASFFLFVGVTHAAVLDVSIEGFEFAPQQMVIQEGDTIVWTNNDAAPHQIVIESFGFVGQMMNESGKDEYTFLTAGTYDYICSVHPMMTGTIVVEAAAPVEPPMEVEPPTEEPMMDEGEPMMEDEPPMEEGTDPFAAEQPMVDDMGGMEDPMDLLAELEGLEANAEVASGSGSGMGEEMMMDENMMGETPDEPEMPSAPLVPSIDMGGDMMGMDAGMYQNGEMDEDEEYELPPMLVSTGAGGIILLLLAAVGGIALFARKKS